jgi:hypothetical protein
MQSVGTDETFTHIFINFAIFVLPPDSLEKCVKLLRPNGFIAFSTWAQFPWFPLIERAHAHMSNPPPLPSYDTVKNRIYQGLPWGAEFVREVLEKANFKDVEIVQKKEMVNVGTPAEFTETMALPLMIITAAWPEADKERLQKEINDGLMAVALEEAGSEEGTFEMEFEGIVGIGRKA